MIVTSYESARSLEACLESLTRQAEAVEIVVADCSAVNPGERLGKRFPAVRFLHFKERRTVPEMRWAALDQTSGEILAVVESRCVPDADWCGKLAAAHAEHPLAPAVGGPVRLAEGATLRDRAIYLVEYGAFAPPIEEGETTEISGANLSYKRAALLECRDLLEQGRWEAMVHARWVAAGRLLRLSGAGIAFRNGMKLGDTFRQRFHYGRSYAADRAAGRPRSEAWLRAATAPLLPAVLLIRLWAHCGKKGLRGMMLESLGWMVLFQTAWSAGECAGYLMGASKERHIY